MIIICAIASSAPARAELPAPKGLHPCKVNEPIDNMARRVASQFGTYAGCFVSTDLVELHSGTKSIRQPLQYALAVDLANGPYTSDDFDALFTTVGQQWKNYNPLDAESREKYEKRLADLIANVIPQGTPKVTMSIVPPILVSLKRLDRNSYAVVSIRQRKMSIEDISVVSTAIDGTALIFRKGRIIRLSLVRELQTTSDAELICGAIAEWVSAIQKGTGG